MKIIDFIILDKETNHLFIQKRSKNRKIFPDQWETPGGHLEENETIIECIRRELFEETNLILECIYGKVFEFFWDDEHTLNTVYLISANGNLKTEDGKISDFRWINKQELDCLMGRNNNIYKSYSRAFEIIENKNKVKDAIVENIQSWLDGSKEISNMYFKNTELLVENKLDGTPVSIADKEIEIFLNKKINKTFPEHNFIGEEGEYEYNNNCKFKWVIDPIDGTRSFIVGRPTFGVLISLVYDNVPIFGCIFQPFTNELWTAFLGEKLYYNKHIFDIKKNKNDNKIESFTSAPEVYGSKRDLKIYSNLKKISYRVSYNGDCYAYGLLSLGFIDLIVEKELASHDYCALIPILCSVNVLFFSWEGIPIDYSTGKTSAIAFYSSNFEKLINIVK